MVGYNKREIEPAITAKGRAPMGRKGIGKLSVFSIADTVEVYSIKDGQPSAFRMSLSAIKEQIKTGDGGIYHPEALDPSLINFDCGTMIILRDVKKDLGATAGHLRRRLARRFSIISTKHGFAVKIDGDEITVRDRVFFDKLEFAWFIGPRDDEIALACKNAKRIEFVSGEVDEEKGYAVTGWIATVDEQKNIDEENNTIVVFAHGKLVQEDVLKDLKEAGIYAQYVIGEIDADFMDRNDMDDIVTSDRQSVKEDDERYTALKAFIRTILKQVQNSWRELRHQVAEERALEQPNVREWYDKLGGDKRKYARQLFAKIESLHIPDKDAKREMYRAGILAFERLALRDSLSVLDSIETESDLVLLTQLFGRIDEIEAVHYYEIARGRLQVVRKFEEILPDAKERLVQKYLFEHLWLLDPSWERAATNPRIEEAVTKEFDAVSAGLSEDEKRGRLDIRYRTAAGKHIIIELKKYDRSVGVFELAEQIRKYRNALDKCLRTKFPDEVRVIECICILGSPPEPHEQENAQENIRVLREIGARYMTYDELIAYAHSSYEAYLAKEKEVSELVALLDRVGEAFELPPPSGEELVRP